MATRKKKEVLEIKVLPPDWLGLKGYEHVLTRWRRLVKGMLLPQVILLEGREGLGKRSLAAALVAMHYCQTGDGCGRCDGCKWVLSGEHPELLWLETHEPSFLLEDAARLQDHLALRPGGGARYRTTVVVDADRFSERAANRLLKTLEEPPPYGRLILTTSRVGSLLDTVLSRCVKWKIKPPEADITRALIRGRLQESGAVDCSDDRVEELLMRSGLAPGKAIGLSEGKTDMSGGRLAPLFEAVEPCDVLAAAEALGRDKGLRLSDVLAEYEMELNHRYRAIFDRQRRMGSKTGGSRTPEDLCLLRSRRQLLREVKRLAVRGRVPLNSQLTCESLAFSGRA